MANYWRQQLVMAGASWVGLAGLIVLIEPEFIANIVWRGSYLPFFCLFWWGWFWLLTAVSGRWKRSLLWASSITGWLWLRLMQLDSWISVSLLMAFNLVWAYYWKISRT